MCCFDFVFRPAAFRTNGQRSRPDALRAGHTVVVDRNDRPGWIVNLTNDGWFGISTGPYQHLQQARLRAIEQGLPLVRAANTGISAVVDPLGRVVAELGLGLEAVLDSGLPAAIPPTPFARAGDVPIMIILVAAWLYVIRRRAAK